MAKKNILSNITASSPINLKEIYRDDSNENAENNRNSQPNSDIADNNAVCHFSENILDIILTENSERKTRTVKLSDSAHRTLQFLSASVEVSIQDVVCNIVELLLEEKKDQIKEIVRKSTKNIF